MEKRRPDDDGDEGRGSTRKAPGREERGNEPRRDDRGEPQRGGGEREGRAGEPHRGAKPARTERPETRAADAPRQERERREGR